MESNHPLVRVYPTFSPLYYLIHFSDKTIRLYKSSTLGNIGKASVRKSFDSQDEDSKLSASQHESWENEAARQGDPT